MVGCYLYSRCFASNKTEWFGDIKTMNIENPVINFRFIEVDGEGEVDHAKHGPRLTKTI